jgi:hypothetical protein
MSQIDFDQFLAGLSAVSEEEFIDPNTFEWPIESDPDAWYFAPELISIYGSAVWDAMDEQQQKRLSFTEAVNFFSMNIHGEKYLISEISRRLYPSEDSELSRYLLHFIDEEARHMMYFSGFCRRYAGKIYPDNTLHSEESGDEELDMFLLFARINVFEELVDYYNKTMAKDDRLAPVVREIHRIHHVEELRHLNFGRNFLKHCLDRHIDDWDRERRDQLREHLSGYLTFAWKQYYNPQAYTDAGIENGFDLWREVTCSAIAAEHRDSINQKRLSYLRKLELLEAE